MKTETLKIGTKFGTELAQYEVSIRIPETPHDRFLLSIGKRTPGRMLPSETEAAEEFQNQMFIRGYRIWLQEQSGARDEVKASTVADRKDSAAMTAKLQSVIDNADPLAPAKRTGRPAKPAEVKVDDAVKAAMQAGDMAALTALLAAQGVKLNIAQ